MNDPSSPLGDNQPGDEAVRRCVDWDSGTREAARSATAEGFPNCSLPCYRVIRWSR